MLGFALEGVVSVIVHLPRSKSVSVQRSAVPVCRRMNSFSTNKSILLLDFSFLCSQSVCCKLLPPTLHSTSWYLCDRCIGPVFHLGQSLTLLITRVRQCEILKYIKSGLRCLFAYQSRQSIVWTMELAINAVWQGLARLFDGASPGSRAACLWIPAQCLGPKVSRVIIKTISERIKNLVFA